MQEGSSCSDRCRVVKYEPVNVIIDSKEQKQAMKISEMNWTSNIRIEKYNTEGSYERGIPDEIQQVKGNIATTKGLFVLWCLGMGKTTTDVVEYKGTSFTGVYPLTQANTYIGVGNGTATASADDLELKGDSNAITFENCETGYPITDPNNPNVLQVKVTFGPSTANHAWNEWGVSNGNQQTPPSGRDTNSIVLFNRRVETMGTKAEGATWVIIADLIISPTASA